MSAVIDKPLDGVARPAPQGRLRKVLAEPLVQFLLLGAAIFAISNVMHRSEDEAANTIVVDDARVKRIAQLYQVQMGSTPAPDQLEHLIDSYIREEVLYREARKLGLDRDDEIVRRRLVQKIEFLSSDLAVIDEPDDAALHRYHEEHPEQFVVPGTVSLSHVFFSADDRGDAGAKRAAEDALVRLATVEDAHAAAGRFGDPFPLQRSYAAADRRSLAQIFGQTPFVDAAFDTAQGRWTGPFRSGYGWHLLYVTQRTPDGRMSFDDAKERARQLYLEEQRRLSDLRRYQELASGYTIVRTHEQDAQP
jgi:peptidyl-prolyl cis-trans isomerase C